MKRKSRLLTSLLVAGAVLGSGSFLAKADNLDASRIANEIYQAAQKQSVQQGQATPSSPAQSVPNNVPSYGGSGSGGSSSGGNNSYYAGWDDDNDSSSGGSSSAGLSDDDYDSDDRGSLSSKPSTKHKHKSSSSSSNDNVDDDESQQLSSKQKAALRADRYLAKVRQKLALKTAQNNDGGAWELRHSYENQLQVIKNGSRTAQTRALQVQLSGELNQLQAAHDNRVNTFNQEIDKLPNSHKTDLKAVQLQDSIDYEDAVLARRQSAVRKKFAKRIKAINPVNKRKAIRSAKKEYHEQLKDKGLTDPYQLQKHNRKVWQRAKQKAADMREDY